MLFNHLCLCLSLPYKQQQIPPSDFRGNRCEGLAWLSLTFSSFCREMTGSSWGCLLDRSPHGDNHPKVRKEGRVGEREVRRGSAVMAQEGGCVHGSCKRQGERPCKDEGFRTQWLFGRGSRRQRELEESWSPWACMTGKLSPSAGKAKPRRGWSGEKRVMLVFRWVGRPCDDCIPLRCSCGRKCCHTINASYFSPSGPWWLRLLFWRSSAWQVSMPWVLWTCFWLGSSETAVERGLGTNTDERREKKPTWAEKEV